MPPKTAPKPIAREDIGNASTSARMANPSLPIDMLGREGSDVPADNSAQRAQISRASGGNAVAGDGLSQRVIPEGIPATGPRPDNTFGNQGRQNPPTSEHNQSSPLLEAGQRQPRSMRDLAVPRSQRNIAVVGNDGLQRRHPNPARDILQPMPARAEPNLNMAGVAQTVISRIESILPLAQSIVWILILIFLFMVLGLIIFRIVSFFFPADAMTDSPRLLFRFLGSGYSNAATIYQVVFPLSVSNPWVLIIVIAVILLVTYIMSCCAKVCYTSPRY